MFFDGIDDLNTGLSGLVDRQVCEAVPPIIGIRQRLGIYRRAALIARVRAVCIEIHKDIGRALVVAVAVIFPYLPDSNSLRPFIIGIGDVITARIGRLIINDRVFAHGPADFVSCLKLRQVRPLPAPFFVIVFLCVGIDRLRVRHTVSYVFHTVFHQCDHDRFRTFASAVVIIDPGLVTFHRDHCGCVAVDDGEFIFDSAFCFI